MLLLEEDRAVVVRMRETVWLALGPRDLAAALELGYFCGNLHWRVRFEGAVLKVALDGPRENYMARLAQHLADGRGAPLGRAGGHVMAETAEALPAAASAARVGIGGPVGSGKTALHRGGCCRSSQRAAPRLPSSPTTW